MKKLILIVTILVMIGCIITERNNGYSKGILLSSRNWNIEIPKLYHLKEAESDKQGINEMDETADIEALEASWQKNVKMWERHSSLLENEKSREPGYQIVTSVYSEEDRVYFEYPQIQGMEDWAKQERINAIIYEDLIKTQITNVLESKGDSLQPDDKIVGNLEYAVTLQTERILSVFYFGRTAFENAHMRFGAAHGITIDLETETVLKLDDFMEINESLVQKIKESPYVMCPPLVYNNDKETYQFVLEGIQNRDGELILSGLNGEYLVSSCGFYLVSDAIVISIDIDYYLGDYALIMFPNSEYEERGKKQANEMNSPLDSWIGEYEFHESIGSAEEPPFMFLDYKIKIYKDASQNYYANILIDGQTTAASGKAKVIGNDKWIDLIFLEYLPDHISGGFPDKEDSILISFERVDGMLLTYWGEILPMPYDNEEPGRIYFEKIL